MVPTHFVRLLALPYEVRARYDVSSMKLMAHTGAKCPVDVKAAMIEWFGPVFRDAYGATEVGTVCAITSEEWLEHRGSVGRSIPPFHAVVLDDVLLGAQEADGVVDEQVALDLVREMATGDELQSTGRAHTVCVFDQVP